MAVEQTSDVTYDLQKQNVYFAANGLKPSTNTTIIMNDDVVDEFCIPFDVLKIEFDESVSTKKRKNWNVNFQRGSKFKIIEPILGSASQRTLSQGKIQYLEVLSYDETTQKGIANVYIYITESGTGANNTLDTQRVVTPNATFLVERSLGTANNKILAYYPRYSPINVATSNTIQLAGKITNSEIANSSSDHYIVGKKIYITSGTGAAQNATVSAYNVTTRTITTVETFDTLPGSISNTSVRAVNRSFVRLGELYSDGEGKLSFLFSLPSFIEQSPDEEYRPYIKKVNRWYKRFRSHAWHGRRTIKLTSKDFSNITIQSVLTSPADTNPTPRDDTDSSGGSVLIPTTQGATPFAQTFYVDDKIYPQGITLTSVRLLFYEKDETYPIFVQIRPTISSIPDASSIVTNGTASISPVDVKLISQDTMKSLNINNTNPFSDPAYYSEAVFENPVFLQSGKEYALVISTPTSKYKLYYSEVGKLLLGTNRTISTQPYLGVLYKSQSGAEWKPSPSEDLAFELMKAKYDTTTPAIIDFYLKEKPADNENSPGFIFLENTAPEANINLHAFYIDSSHNILPNTNVSYEFMSTRNDGSSDLFTGIRLDTTYEFADNKGYRVLTPNANSFIVRASMYTSNPDVTPSIDYNSLNLVGIRNIIDNNTLSNSNFFITNLGQDYSNGQNVIVTISGGGGTGATARANVQSGQVVAIEIINGGSGYTGSPNVIISRDTTATINAQAVVIGEDQPNGGVADAKYITKKFSLADGISAGDMRVLFSAVKARECEIDVYYKVLSEDDADSFNNKRWTRMTLIGGINAYSATIQDYKNYIYAPGVGNVANNSINYDGFTSFKYFAVKVVMRSTDQTKVPKITNFRITTLAELLT